MTGLGEVRFCRPDDWPEAGAGVVHLQAPDPDDDVGLAQAVLRGGLSALAGGGSPAAGEPCVWGPQWPTMDHVLALWLLGRESHGAGDAHCEALASYARSARLGLAPGSAPPESSPRTVFEELKRDCDDLASPSQARRLVLRSFDLFDALHRRMSEGRDLFGRDILDGLPDFQPEIALLRKDRSVYLDDRQRGRAYHAVLRSPVGEHPVDLLLLDNPLSSRFMEWARQDPDAENGAGFALLLARDEDGAWLLSSDPARRLRVGRLAEPLQGLEDRVRRGAGAPPLEDDPWYDGSRHGGTLVGSPRAGTVLDREQILRTLQEPLSLRAFVPGEAAEPAATKGRVPRPWALIAAILVIAAAVAFATVGPGPEPQRSAEAPSPVEEALQQAVLLAERGSPVEDVDAVASIREEGSARRHFAVIAGVNKYETEQSLECANADARALKDLLMQHYGYRRDDIVYLVDEPEEGERTEGLPTTTGLRRAIEQVGEWSRQVEDSTFLFFYAGHGKRFEKASRIGFLIPHGSDAPSMDPTTPLDMRYYDMQYLPEDIKKYIASQHTMLLVDSCFSGFALRERSAQEIDPTLYEMWSGEARVILTAGTHGQTAKEDPATGHSLFTMSVLDALTPGAGDRLAADINGDGIVTDSELGGFVGRAVPRLISRYPGATGQTPQYLRDDSGGSKVGQFLLIPTAAQAGAGADAQE